VKYDTAQRLIEEAMKRAAEPAGLCHEQLDDMSVQDCGLLPLRSITPKRGRICKSTTLISYRTSWK
jgi:hypothetical protein